MGPFLDTQCRPIYRASIASLSKKYYTDVAETIMSGNERDNYMTWLVLHGNAGRQYIKVVTEKRRRAKTEVAVFGHQEMATFRID